MTLILSVKYHTYWGESIGLIFEGSEQVHPLTYVDADNWQIELDCPQATTLKYHYVVCRNNEQIRKEWGEAHTLHIKKEVKSCRVFDNWNDIPVDNAFFSSAFTHSIYARKSPKKTVQAAKAGSILIQVKSASIAPDEVLAISGSCKALGEWDIKKTVKMNDCLFPTWTAVLDATKMGGEFEYKFVILDAKSGEVKAWENRSNRHFIVPQTADCDAIVIADTQVTASTRTWKGAGVAVPVFSLRSEKSFGVGDFADIRLLVDWAAATEQRIIQILPINDTTMTGSWQDSYPYSANSIYALHPQYLRLDEVGFLKDKERIVYYEQTRKELNALADVDYERVNRFKNEYLKEIFEQDGATTLVSKEFLKFFNENKHWLVPYAAYRTLCSETGTPDFNQWGAYAIYDANTIATFDAPESPYCNTMRLHYFTQYHLHLQLLATRDYAHSKGVVLKGDIPIGISPRSADAWATPKYFHLNSQAGAPPDDFSVLGQNWFLPTYNWDEMDKDGYIWWKSRFSKMAEYFDAYRIDHILGFFRIWEIPYDALHGLLGHFSPAMPFSTDELASRGFNFDKNLYTYPYVRDYMLGEIFGQYTEEVRNQYLSPLGGGSYGMRPEVNTQRKVHELFAGQDDERSTVICEGLMRLHDEVLFVEDPIKVGHYHPRISAWQSYIYQSMPEYQRHAFDALYNDFFYYRHNDFWYHEAMKKLPPLLSATNMLVCGEDLGMIPHCVPAVMNQLQILSLEVQRMPKDANSQFGCTWNYPYLSVGTTSTHDMSGIRAWWEEDREAMQDFYNRVLCFGGNTPYFCEPYICERILEHHLASPSMLVILPLQDWLSMDEKLRRENPLDERINVPAINPFYWKYRMHMTIEELIAATEFNNRLREKISQSGR